MNKEQPAGAVVTTPATPVKSKPSAEGNGLATMSPFSSRENFEDSLRAAKALASSDMVPTAYQGKVQNCLIALELAARIGAPAFQVMQNMDIIHGRPGLRATFLIGTINASKRFSPLRFQWEENGEPTTPVGCASRGDSFGCRAVAKDLQTGEECIGALISWAMVKAEGWSKKAGSKWLTMPEQLFMYRAGAFWSRVYCPEISLGMQTDHEVLDTTGYTVSESAVPLRSGSTVDLNAALLAPAVPESGPKAVEHDEDGVIREEVDHG